MPNAPTRGRGSRSQAHANMFALLATLRGNRTLSSVLITSFDFESYRRIKCFIEHSSLSLRQSRSAAYRLQPALWRPAMVAADIAAADLAAAHGGCLATPAAGTVVADLSARASALAWPRALLGARS